MSLEDTRENEEGNFIRKEQPIETHKHIQCQTVCYKT